MKSLRTRGGEDLAGVAVDEADSEGGGALAEATQHPRALLVVVRDCDLVGIVFFVFE